MSIIIQQVKEDRHEIAALEFTIFGESSFNMDAKYCFAAVDQSTNKQVGYILADWQDKDAFPYGLFNEDLVFNIVSFGVLEDYKRKGIGEQLVKELISKTEDVKSIFLQVRISNEPAIKLYEKLGFKQHKTIDDYYNNPEEDGYLYWLDKN